MSRPVPEQKIMNLQSAGFTWPTVTEHRFVGARECVVSGPDETGHGGAAWAFIFECSITGERRRYGVVDRDPKIWPTPPEEN